MEVFILKTLRRIKKEAPRRCKELKISTDELIALLEEKEKYCSNGNLSASIETDADKYYYILAETCECRYPRLMEVALDAFHFLIEHGFLKGNQTIQDIVPEQEWDSEEKPKQKRILIDALIETVSKCSDEFDDGVQLQVRF
jgi:hypothetical protein